MYHGERHHKEEQISTKGVRAALTRLKLLHRSSEPPSTPQPPVIEPPLLSVRRKPEPMSSQEKQEILESRIIFEASRLTYVYNRFRRYHKSNPHQINFDYGAAKSTDELKAQADLISLTPKYPEQFVCIARGAVFVIYPFEIPQESTVDVAAVKLDADQNQVLGYRITTPKESKKELEKYVLSPTGQWNNEKPNREDLLTLKSIRTAINHSFSLTNFYTLVAKELTDLSVKIDRLKTVLGDDHKKGKPVNNLLTAIDKLNEQKAKLEVVYGKVG